MTITAYLLVCFCIMAGQGGDHPTAQDAIVEYGSIEYDNLKNDLMKDITILDAMIKDGVIDDSILENARMKLAMIQDAMNKKGIIKEDIFLKGEAGTLFKILKPQEEIEWNPSEITGNHYSGMN